MDWGGEKFSFVKLIGVVYCGIEMIQMKLNWIWVEVGFEEFSLSNFEEF